MTNWWKNGSNSGVSGTWWGGGNGGAGGTCLDGCGGETKCTFGCTNPLAINYDPLAQCEDGSCDIITYDECVGDPPPPCGACFGGEDCYGCRCDCKCYY